MDFRFPSSVFEELSANVVECIWRRHEIVAATMKTSKPRRKHKLRPCCGRRPINCVRSSNKMLVFMISANSLTIDGTEPLLQSIPKNA